MWSGTYLIFEYHRLHSFNVYESVHYKYILLYIQQDATLHILYLEIALHVSGGTPTHHQKHIQLYRYSGR
jgi:hypothetical protein